ncbi:MAG: hypothetical protein ABJC33_02545 [Betaproteobacteria bacterium]
MPERAIVEGSDAGAIAPPGSAVEPVTSSVASDRSGTLHASAEQTVSEPDSLPLDVPIPGDRLMRLFDEAHLAVPGDAGVAEPVIVTRRTGHWSRWPRIMLAGGLLFALLATSAIALFAHYRPGAIDRGVATARMALRGGVSPTTDAIAPRGNSPVQRAVPVSTTLPAAVVSADPPPRDAGIPEVPAVASEASGMAAPAPKDPDARSMPAASGNASVRPPTRAAVAKRTPARTAGVRTPKAPVTSAHGGRSRTSAGVAARKPSSTGKSTLSGARNSSPARPVPCTAAQAASGLCAPAAQDIGR